MRVTASYQDITRVKADIFVAGFTAAPRPTRGLVGRVDWYLGGFISRQILAEALKGREGEMTLVALQGKLLTPRLLLVGMGQPDVLDREAAADSFRRVGPAVRAMHLTTAAIEIPALETPRSGSYKIVGETLAGFREAFQSEGKAQHCEVQILARTEEESEGWRRVVRGLLR